MGERGETRKRKQQINKAYRKSERQGRKTASAGAEKG